MAGNKTYTKPVLRIQGESAVHAPTTMGIVIAAVVIAVFGKLTEQYINRDIQRFGGEAKGETCPTHHCTVLRSAAPDYSHHHSR